MVPSLGWASNSHSRSRKRYLSLRRYRRRNELERVPALRAIARVRLPQKDLVDPPEIGDVALSVVRGHETNAHGRTGLELSLSPGARVPAIGRPLGRTGEIRCVRLLTGARAALRDPGIEPSGLLAAAEDQRPRWPLHPAR